MSGQTQSAALRQKALKSVGNFPLDFGGNVHSIEPQKRRRTTSPSPAPDRGSSVGICFDIDGVFKHGGRWEPKGAAALKKVIDAKVPYCFMTNGGGGRTEQEYADEINSKLQQAQTEASEDMRVPSASSGLKAENMVMSYTPWHVDLAHLKDEPILIVGAPKENVMNVVKSYGFHKAIHLQDYDNAHPLMNPFKNENTKIDTANETWTEGFKAVCVYTDPLDLFMALQIVIDVLLSSRPGQVEYEDDHLIPIYFSNPDLLWKTQYPHGRFGQGAFRLTLQSLYVARLHSLGVDEARVARRLSKWIQYGKPSTAQYQYAIKQLQKIGKQHGVRKITHYYMVGDNPHSDMQGCINMNALGKQFASWSSVIDGQSTPTLPGWSGVLVRTGVWAEGDDPNDAAAVVGDVHDAVEWILKQNGI